ncbi:hypothetical protein PV327_004227 [Microctonus hyperodae]|uniref:Agrin n=1 Tax=Microctonus hyperodae TaxID=165561 RepID=A0AA39FC40_MICHY|nr:hypothetical protein PV327_004227 [Microctonus hyperodae]
MGKESNSVNKVCGSDGETYASECALKNASCIMQIEINIAFEGDCKLCTNVVCENGARCAAGECICPESCPEESGKTVCGTDGKTYQSECELQRIACDRDKIKELPLHVAFHGECGEKFAVAALTTMSTALITRQSTTITDVTSTQEREACKDIHCDFEATCELDPDKFPRCSCKFDCASIPPENIRPVCGSDLKIYSSICAMKMEACQRQQELRLRPLDLCEGMEVKPCNGDQPLTDSDGKEYDCGSGLNRRDCPSNSYCHQTTRFARCCKKVQGIQVVKCLDSWHGCCPDGKTAALGPDGAGCPSLCNCNRLGSMSDTCNPETGQCDCRPGVGGLKCDRCMPGYWGLPKISEGHQGCIPCGCSLFGSIREDCEQMTGRCVCNPEIQGHKCTICTDHNKILTPTGCYSGSQSDIRGRKATAHILKEILELCEIIYQNGQPCKDHPEITGISFGDLFNIYVAISDKCVGLLLRARKQGLVEFEGECLFQRRDDNVPVFLVKPISEIRTSLKQRIQDARLETLHQ